jgi:hypothetical protein
LGDKLVVDGIRLLVATDFIGTYLCVEVIIFRLEYIKVALFYHLSIIHTFSVVYFIIKDITEIGGACLFREVPNFRTLDFCPFSKF